MGDLAAERVRASGRRHAEPAVPVGRVRAAAGAELEAYGADLAVGVEDTGTIPQLGAEGVA